MRKFIILSWLLAFAVTAFGQQQQAQKVNLAAEDYFKKSKRQKKTATILLGAGAGLIVSAFVIPRGKLVQDGFCFIVCVPDEYKNDDLKAAVFLTGVVSAVGSIPFYIIARKNRKKGNALSAFMDMEKIPQLQQVQIVNQTFPALGMRLRL